MSCPVVETSAGEPLISKRPFAVGKWSAWLVSKESPFLWGSMPSYTQIYNILPHSPVIVSLQTAHKNTLFPIWCEDETNVQECLHMVKWGVQRVASEPPQAPGYLSPLGRLANKKIYWPILCNMSLLTPGSRWPGITLRGVSSVNSPSSSTISRHWSLTNVHFSPVSFSSLEVQMLFTILSLNTAVLWHFHHKCTIS